MYGSSLFSSLMSVFHWFCIGFLVGYYFYHIQKQIPPVRISFSAASVIAITLAIVSLFLLIAGYDNTLIVLFSFGAGNIAYLIFLYVWNKSEKTMAKKKLQKLISSNIAKNYISFANQKQ